MTPGTPARSTVSERWSRAVPSWARAVSSEACAVRKASSSLIVLPLGREALGEQRLLALVGGGRLAEHGLGGLDGGLGGGHRRLLLLRVESGQHLVGRHVVADIDQALGDAAPHPKGQIALDLRADLAGQPHRRRIVGQRGRLDLHHGRRVLRPAGLLLAGGETQGDYEDHACGGSRYMSAREQEIIDRLGSPHRMAICCKQRRSRTVLSQAVLAGAIRTAHTGRNLILQVFG